MSLVFLHSADWQIGKPFASLSDQTKRTRLQAQRIETIHTLKDQVQSSGAAFVLVAGDLFDSPHVTKATVSAACAAIGALQVPVLVIAGNHDHGGVGSIWQQDFFRHEQEALAPNLRILLDAEPLVLDEAIIFPASLLRRHETGDPTAWIREAALDPNLPTDRPRIVLAHGTIQGFSSTQDDEDGGPATINWIDLASLPDEAIDYIALGDWHGTKQVGPKAWYSGTPEIDRFPKGEGNDPGHILKVSLERSKPPQVEKITTSRFAWKELAFHFSEDRSLETFSAKLDELTEAAGTRVDELLLLLSLDGSLGIEASSRLEQILEALEARLIRLKLDSRVTIAPTEDEIIALTQRSEDPLIATVATALVTACDGESEDAAIARIALRELHSALG